MTDPTDPRTDPPVAPPVATPGENVEPTEPMEPDQPDGRRPAAREALWQRLVIGAFAGLIRLVDALPTRVAYAIGNLLAVPWFLWWQCRDRRGRRSSGYWRNTRIAFREGAPLGPDRPRHHLWRWSRHIALVAIDFCRMTRIRRDNVHEFCDLEEYPRLAELFDKGQGLIFATGHVGVWDVSGHVAGVLGLPIKSVFRPSPLPALNRLIENLRTNSGQTVVARKNVMWTLKKTLADKEAIALLADGGGKHSAVIAPFLGVQARTIATPAVMHLATGAPIAVVAVLRTGRMRYRLRVYDIIEDGGTGDREHDLVALTARINRALGQAVKEAPEQWFWQSRRFRHRPPGERPDPDGLPPLVPTESSGPTESPGQARPLEPAEPNPSAAAETQARVRASRRSRPTG